MKQLAMELPTWGGRRKGAGRKPKGRVALVSHEARPEFDGRTPVHVVMRVRDDVRSLRARATFPRHPRAPSRRAESGPGCG